MANKDFEVKADLAPRYDFFPKLRNRGVFCFRALQSLDLQTEKEQIKKQVFSLLT